MARLKIKEGGVWYYAGYGYSGVSGYSGSQFVGSSGYSGSGVSGYSGYSGISGYSGYSGKSGYSGISGYSGSGTSGYSGPTYGWKGAYNAGTAYVPRDTAQYLGASYVCIQSGTGQTPAPSGTSYWDLLTASGYSGISGYSGASGYAIYQ